MPEQQADISAQRVTYRVEEELTIIGDAWGDTGNPPVLLLHGGGQTRFAWGNTARTLAEHGWYAVSLDLRGHGESGWAPDGNYNIEKFSADLHVVLDHFDRRPVLVGSLPGRHYLNADRRGSAAAGERRGGAGRCHAAGGAEGRGPHSGLYDRPTRRL